MAGRLTGSLLLVAAVTVGCSDNPPEEQVWPLTGLPGYVVEAQTQVVTVKIDNTEAGRPQAGLADADLIVQEMVEGGVTRLAAMYHSQLPTSASPVRSLRETDVGLVLPTGGTLAASGGAEDTLSTVTSAGVPIAVEGDPGFARDSGRSAPYNLMLDVTALAETLQHSPPAAPYLPFGAVPDEAGKPAHTADVTWPADEVRFELDSTSGLWQRADLPGATGLDFTNVVALTLPVTYAGKDAAGTAIPTMHTEGQGAGVILTGGSAYNVTWSKATPSSPWTFASRADAGSAEDAQVEDFSLPPGRTWLALLPEDGGAVSFSGAPAADGSLQH